MSIMFFIIWAIIAHVFMKKCKNKINSFFEITGDQEVILFGLIFLLLLWIFHF